MNLGMSPQDVEAIQPEVLDAMLTILAERGRQAEFERQREQNRHHGGEQSPPPLTAS